MAHWIMAHWILFLLLVRLVIAAVHSATVSSERSALLLLAKSIGADTSRGWNHSSDPCSDWVPDVGCDSSGRVTRIQIKHLVAAPRSGRLPPQIAALTSLVKLELPHLSLTGPLPSLSPLSSLQVLYLQGNLLDSIPAGFFSGLVSLVTIFLDDNPFVPWHIDSSLKACTRLEEFSAHKASLRGVVPAFLGDLPSLRMLNVSDNSLTGPVPKSLTKLATLKSVALNNNLLQGPAPNFTDGVELDLDTESDSFCHDSSEPCDPRVEVLLSVAASVGYPIAFAEDWKGNDPCAQWMGIGCDRDGRIVTVNFKKQNLTGVISPDFEKLGALVNLDLSDNNLVGIIPPGLVNLESLKELDVSNNDINGPLPIFWNRATVKVDGNPYLTTYAPTTVAILPDDLDSREDGNGGGGRKKPSVKVIAASVCGGTAVLVGLLLIFFFLKKKLRNYGKPPSHSGAMDGCTANRTLVIKMELLREATNNFSQDNILGRGGFGTVYRGRLHDGRLIAVKRMEAAAMGLKGTNQFKSEISVLTKVRHRHLVFLLGYCLEGNEKILVYEYMPQGTLSRHLFHWSKEGLKPLEWMRRLSIALDVARGVDYLHSLANQTFIHRDLKPSNILLGDDMRAKVADFGLVRLAPQGKHCSVVTRLAGTFGYLAPEYAATGRLTTKADIFSFGVILLELITGRKAVEENQTEDDIYLVSWFRRMQEKKETFQQAIDPIINIADEETLSSVLIVSELAGHCCAQDPHQRPDMDYAVNAIASLVEHWKPSDQNDDGYGKPSDQNDDGYGILLDGFGSLTYTGR